jgi:hypothetical protein
LLLKSYSAKATNFATLWTVLAEKGTQGTKWHKAAITVQLPAKAVLSNN